MPRLEACTQPVGSLSVERRRQMYRLYRSYYDACTSKRFEYDLAEKTHALLLLDDTRTVRGFSTLARFKFEFDDQPRQAIFSGDTIVHHQFWGEQTLPMAWLELTGTFKAERLSMPLYWFLIVKGYRTYRYLPLFARRYYPSHREPTPASLQAMLDWLADQRFGDHYDRHAGLVQFDRSLGHLAPEWAKVPQRVAQRPEVKFFLNRNPGYARGDELACITELHSDNLTRRARVAFERGLVTC